MKKDNGITVKVPVWRLRFAILVSHILYWITPKASHPAIVSALSEWVGRGLKVKN